MSTKRKRLTRKEIRRPDEFITTTTKVVQFLAANIKPIGIALGLIVLFFLIGNLVNWITTSSETKAQNLLYLAINSYKELAAYNESEEKDESKKPKITYQELIEKFQTIAKDYSRNQAGKIALLYLGDCYFNTNQFDKAVETYKKFIDSLPSNDDLILLGYQNIGYSYESLGDYQKAIEYYEKIINSTAPNLREIALMNAGRCYEAIGNYESALSSYEKITKEYPKSRYVIDVKDKMAILKDKLPGEKKPSYEENKG